MAAYLAHNAARHEALRVVLMTGVFPVASDRGILGVLIRELIKGGMVSGVARSSAPVQLTPAGLDLWNRWLSPEFRRCACVFVSKTSPMDAP